MQKTISGFFRRNIRVISWLFFLLLPSISLFSQPFRYTRKINWNNIKTYNRTPQDSVTVLTFQGAAGFPKKFGDLSVFIEAFPLFTFNDSIVTVKIENQVFEDLGYVSLTDSDKIESSPSLLYSVTLQRKKPFLNINLLPLVKDPDGKIKKLVSFTIVLEILPGASNISYKSVKTYADNSVLSSGKWIKLFLDKTGVYRLTQADLLAIDPGFASVDPRTIRVYGNGGAMLPESVVAARADDLREISVQVAGEEDGKLDASDYLLFYAEGPYIWKYNQISQNFSHIKHLYTDQTCYFITYGEINGKRIGVMPSTNLTPTDYISFFDDHLFYENDDINLIKSGKIWYDKDKFEFTTTRNYAFNFPDIDIAQPVVVRADVAGRSTMGNTTFLITGNGQQVATLPISAVSSDYYARYADSENKTGSFSVDKPSVDIKIVYNKSGNEAIGFLNYLEISAKRHLKFSGDQLAFRSVLGHGLGKVAEYTLSATGQQLTIWDVTKNDDVRAVQTSITGSDYKFKLKGDTLREFIAFDGSAYLAIKSHEVIENQNLHGVGSHDYLIISHPDFIEEANQLAEFHRTHDQLSAVVVTPEKIYNEFSSGVQDITALRDFAKMMYDKSAPGQEIKYMLLFGDASYDYKNRLFNNSNYVPAYQSNESLEPILSFATDDFFALLENNDSLQIGLGRLPVNTKEEARAALKKIRNYTSNSDSVKNDWRNIICFVSDDEDNNAYMDDADDLTLVIQSKDNIYNIDKIYLDAYPQISTPGGARAPEVNAAINSRMEKGALIVNYIGHGGEKGWAHERILEIPDIKEWKNFTKLPVFLTATCEFSRYDDPNWVSAGEWVFLNPEGGGIALFTTTRPTYAGDNYSLSFNFYSAAFNKTEGKYPKMGDVIMRAKNRSGGVIANRKFILIGDPAIQMAYPDLNVVTTEINQHPVPGEQDTIRALSTMTVSGKITDDGGNLQSDFNGSVFPTIYDKEAEITTLAYDGGAPYIFSLRKNVIYKGKTDVVNGEFNFSFIVPKDIAYNYGSGRISYYARSNNTDASGFESGFIVGGYDNTASVDVTAPMIRLFMNDTNFVSGGMTDQSPVLLALISDESGINTVGNGIGHDITVTLDNDTKDQKIVNDYYSANQNTYKSGNVEYPFFNLSDGLHSVRLKIWDVYNNSTDASLQFVVVSSAELALDHIFNYPNPFTESTTFSFEYNKANSVLDVTIRIYNLSGQMITTINEKMYTAGYRANIITWDGRTASGDKINSGNYVYNVIISTPEGETVQKASRMVVIR